MEIVWIAYCITCNQQVGNGQFSEHVTAVAKIHIKHNKGHKVIVGYEPK